MLGGDAKTLAVSVAIHGGLIAVLALFAARQVTKDDDPPPIDLEILPPAVRAADPPRPKVAPPVVPVVPPVIPTTERPKLMPRRTPIRVTKTPTPYQPDAPETKATRAAPPDTTAVPAPTTPMPELNMEATVGAGGGDYSSTATYADGTVGVGKGPGGDGHGAGGGRVGPLANQGAVGVKVSRDWEVTQLPTPLNDRSFDPDYPPRARREKREARVTVRLYIDDTGSVRKATVLDGPRGDGFRKSALAYAHKLRFRPALSGKRKVAARIDWTVLFYVRN